MPDLFETPELLPENVKAILNRYNALEIEKGIELYRPYQYGQGNGYLWL